MTGKPVQVGATLRSRAASSPRSPFKYERHNEICLGSTMGKGSFICCYATLNADQRSYAGFPEGFPRTRPSARFSAARASIFSRDMGFDYLWFSNGLGFGLETWATVGPLFDGQTFDVAGRPRFARRFCDSGNCSCRVPGISHRDPRHQNLRRHRPGLERRAAARIYMRAGSTWRRRPTRPGRP